MAELEERIKVFLKDQGITVAGIAGPERLSGPPSIDPTYVLKGAKSVISLALPMSVPAIYDFLSKKSQAPHNFDQLKHGQKMHRIAKKLADFLEGMGYKAAAVPTNNTYRRSPDIFANRPSFSHRYGAVVSGVGAFGISGNVITKEYGASIYLGSVVTNAVLKSDPLLPARYFIDSYCHTCKLCEKACPLQMFQADDEEFTLLNGELHARGKRRNIDLCAISCFGLHALSPDKKWSSWGRHWVKQWINNQPDYNDRTGLRAIFSRMGAKAGDSTPRYEVIRRSQAIVWPQEKVENLLPDYDMLPASEGERYRDIVQVEENMGVKGLKDAYTQTCGQCSLICGPNFQETKKRFYLLTQSGFVVPGADGKTVHVKTFEEAMEIREKYPYKVTSSQIVKDAASSGNLFVRYYFGFEPKSELQNFSYRQRLKRACSRAGLAGKEAKDPAVYDLRWTLLALFSGRKRKYRLNAARDALEYRV